MGYSVGAFCDCGYRRYNLMIGYGMRPGGPRLPFLCKPCKEVFSANVQAKPAPCPSCGEPSKTHVRKRTWSPFLPKAKLTCPKCGEKTLQFGNFDVYSQISFCRWD